MSVVSVFESQDYKVVIRAWIEARPKGGRGESRKIADRLAISTTLVSQVINGDKNFTLEASSELCDYMGFAERETDHFLSLVEYARAGSHGLREKILLRLKKSRDDARKLSERVESDVHLSETQSAIYYSHWVYTGITNWIATKPDAAVDEIAERLKVPVPLVAKVLSFLLESGILINRGGSYDIGAKRTVIGADSPLVVKHHQNWRLQAFNRMPFTDERNMFFTMPMSLSQEVADRIRSDLPSYIERLAKWIGPSPSEVVRCLNIDYFEY